MIGHPLPSPPALRYGFAMRLAIFLGLASVIGCAKPDVTPGSTGSVVFAPGAMVVTPDAGAPVDMTSSILATEIEVMRSDSVIRAAVRARGLAGSFKLTEDGTVEALRGDTSVARRGQSLVLEVTVRVADPALAKESCTAIISAYVEARMSRRIELAAEREMWLRAQLDALDASSPMAVMLRTSADEAALERTRRDNDVTTLDACSTPARGK
jgi:uncharacterized protein involved in exopolysaccharide biosynthesis